MAMPLRRHKSMYKFLGLWSVLKVVLFFMLFVLLLIARSSRLNVSVKDRCLFYPYVPLLSRMEVQV
jgi:hypothetical protein